MWRIWWAPNNASRWQMGFNSASKGLRRALQLYRKFHQRAISMWTKICSPMFIYDREVQIVVTGWLVTEGKEFQVHGSVHRCSNLNRNANLMYFVLKSLKFCLHYSALHVSDNIVSIIRSFLPAHAVSGPVWCLVRCVLQSCYVVT